MASVVVTVGMGRWPFDRLVRAADALAEHHDVFVQTGTSSIVPQCPHARFVPPDDLRRRTAAADVVVTHAGNTVRQLQRRGIVPLAVARRPELGEMGNDHQVRFLRREQHRTPVVALWDVEDLADRVEGHFRDAEAVRSRPVPELADPARLSSQLDELAARPASSGPFDDHPLRRYSFAWEQLVHRRGRHLDLGCGDATFLAALHATARGLDCIGAEVAAGPLAVAADRVRSTSTRRRPALVRSDRRTQLPFASSTFDSASALDVLEHVPDTAAALAELRRVLRPGGVLVATVPAQHAFSVLDPDDAKLRWPRLHGVLYRARFGRAAHHRRFEDLSDGFRGDLAVERDRHTNYRPEELAALLGAAGFRAVERDGANLFWQLVHPVALLGGRRTRALAARAIRADGRRFDRANLFVVAVAQDEGADALVSADLDVRSAVARPGQQAGRSPEVAS